jgi:hypothetical protein
MRPVTLALLLAISLGGHAFADDVSSADRAAIDKVITAQIEAFRRDDGNAAFGFAAPNIQRKFGDGAHFLAVVRDAYPPVFRPRHFTFGDLDAEDGTVTQKVTFIGPDGAAALALYDMEHEPDGSWRIGGCSLVETAQQSI